MHQMCAVKPKLNPNQNRLLQGRWMWKGNRTQNPLAVNCLTRLTKLKLNSILVKLFQSSSFQRFLNLLHSKDFLAAVVKNWIDISSGPIDTPDVASHCTALRCNRRSLHVPSTIFESYQHLNLFLILNDTRCCIALHPQSCIALHCIALHCSPRVALHCMIPDVALHCIAAPELHCIALQPQISPCSLSCIHQYLNLINIWNSFISDWHYLQKSLTVSTSSTFVQMRINIFKKSLTL